MRYRSFRRVLPWMVVHPASHRVPRAPWYSGSRPACRPFAYEGLALSAVPSQALPLGRASLLPVLNPGGPRAPGLGSSRFARRYWGNHFCLLFLRLLRCFSSPGSLRMTMDSSYGDRSSFCRVSPFGYLRINGYLLLPAAFRSLSRPSSAPGAKASALRPL